MSCIPVSVLLYCAVLYCAVLSSCINSVHHCTLLYCTVLLRVRIRIANSYTDWYTAPSQILGCCLLSFTVSRIALAVVTSWV